MTYYLNVSGHCAESTYTVPCTLPLIPPLHLMNITLYFPISMKPNLKVIESANLKYKKKGKEEKKLTVIDFSIEKK